MPSPDQAPDAVDLVVASAPADTWQEASPAGNGVHGALVHGRPDDESVVVTHHDLVLPHGTAGIRAPGRPLPWARPFHPAFAVRLVRDGVPGRGTWRRAGRPPDGYRRTTDLATGVITVCWTGAEGPWRRDCFVSRADDVVVLRVVAPDGGWDGVRLAHQVRLPGAPEGLRVDARSDVVVLGDGRALGPAGGTCVVRVSYPDAGPGGSAGYVGVTRVVARGPQVLLLTRVARGAAGGGAAAVTEAEERCRGAVAAIEPDHDALLARHVALHGAAYRRVRLRLDVAPQVRATPLAELLEQARTGGGPQVEAALAERCFAAGRYHLLSASGARPPRPTGLWQGGWEAARPGASSADTAHGYLHRALAAARLREPEQLAGLLSRLLTGDYWFDTLMSSRYPGRMVFDADAACALPGVLLEGLVDSGPGRLDLLPTVPRQLARGRLTGARTRARVVVAHLEWDLAAGTAHAVLVSPVEQRVSVRCRGSARQVDLEPGTPVEVPLLPAAARPPQGRAER